MQIVGYKGDVDKRKQSVGETSLPKPSLNIPVKQFKAIDAPIPPPSDDKERDEESYASEFVDLVFHDDDDFDNTIEPESNKENPKTIDDDDNENKKEKQDDNDDDVNDDHTDHTLDETQETRSLETRNEKIVHPTTSSSTTTPSSADLQHQLYLKIKKSLQDQADDLELWEVLKQKFEKSLDSSGPCRTDTFRSSDAPPEREKRAKSKNEKRDMYFMKIVKFCDATLERVLNEVKLKIFETEFLKKDSLLGDLNLDITKAYEREITKHLRHREQTRRWESFVNRRPILLTM
nr:hypothetical protein [Tanacetum cinerariifolium]